MMLRLPKLEAPVLTVSIKYIGEWREKRHLRRDFPRRFRTSNDPVPFQTAVIADRFFLGS